MTVAERGGGAVRRGREFRVRPLRDRDQIRARLEGRRAYAAYALGQLDPRLFRYSDWWFAEDGAASALILHSRGGLGNATFALGETSAVEALLQVHPGPRHTFLTCEVHHVETILRYFELDQRQTMIRMHLTAASFTPSADGIEVRRLTGRDARDINALYRSEGVPSYYTAKQIDDSVYFGIDRGTRLIAVAGTHVISPAGGIAVVGNVYTHPKHRGQHLAQATTSAVTAQLLTGCRDIVLSVDPTNEAAVRAYERLGYSEVARLVEGAAVRRDSTGVVTAARRVAARLRGRGSKTEIVRVRAA